MKKIYSLITSLSFMAFLFIILIFSMAVATFVESSHGTAAARAFIYNAHWFEVVWALLALNLINNLVKYRLYTKKKLTIGLFHLSFLILLLGAGVTRYFGFEGVMHIREDQSAGSMRSSGGYFFAGLGEHQEREQVLFSELTPRQFSASFEPDGERIRVQSVGFISGAERKAIPAESGEPAVDLVFSSPEQKGMQTHSFSPGDLLETGGFSAGFETEKVAGIRFFVQDDSLLMTSRNLLTGSTMTSEATVEYVPGDTIPVRKMFLYHQGEVRFLIRNFYPKARFTAVKSSGSTGQDAVMVEITGTSGKQVIPVFGRAGAYPDTVKVPAGEHMLRLAYGAVQLPLPFRIYLKDFQLERYPGSGSPSSYASEVVLMDEAAGVERDVRIFMNRPLLYKGYKFFQSSYDPDEKGTVLSVNHDLWGTWITYLGYALMTLGMVLSLVNPSSHFRSLVNRLKKGAVKKTALVVLALGLAFSSSAQEGKGAGMPGIDKKVVKAFSELWVQGVDGRVKPMGTLTSEVLRKVSRKSSLYGKSSDEVVLSMMAYPDIWRSQPVIRVSNKTLAAQLGMEGKYIAVRQLFDEQGNYKISRQVRAAYAKTPALRNRVEKETIYLDERVSIFFMVFRGSFFHVFPRAEKEAAWYAPGEEAEDYTGADSLFVKHSFHRMVRAISHQNTAEALDVINGIERFQQKYGAGLLPSVSKKQVEIAYNKVNPFERIFPFYLLSGFVLLFILFIHIFRLKPLSEWVRKPLFGLIFLLFVVHTAGLIARWYISGHAPWSNGYESIVYVAWAAMLAGFVFGRRYPMVVGTAGFLAGISLFVAHLSWMNPEITPLVPVLKSYWLTIHVSVITASYGFIGLSAFLGILVLILIVLRKKSNESKVNVFIHQLTTINEMSATAGLYFLTIGTFLGAVWANESWGRYWGWDPKETWSLITIVVYSFIVHMRLIPSLKGIFSYNLASVLGLISVLMTYFGVNYYLTGLHSYGSGVAYGINPAVPVVMILIAGLMVWAYIKDSSYLKEKNIT